MDNGNNVNDKKEFDSIDKVNTKQLDNSMNSNYNSNKESGKKKKITMLDICIILSVISVIGVMVWVYFTYGELGYSVLSEYIMMFLECIWGFYFFVFITKYLYNKKKVLGILFVIFCILVVIILQSERFFSSNIIRINGLKHLSVNDDFAIDSGMLYYGIMEYNFSKRNSLLYSNEKSSSNIFKTTLNAVDVNNINNDKYLCNFSTNMSFLYTSSFYFVRNNELYYSALEPNRDDEKIFNKKINLDNCEITDLISDYEMFDVNMNYEDYIYMYKYNDDEEDTTFIKYDYINNKILNSQKTYADLDYISGDEVLIDYNNFDIYSVDGETLYKNEVKVYETPDEYINLLLMNGNTLFFYDDEMIYEFDLTTNSIVNKMDNEFEELSRIFNYNNNNYFVADKKVYKYNGETKNFEFVFNLPNNDEYVMYDYGDKYLISNGYEVFLFDVKSKLITMYKYELFKYNNGILYLVDIDDNDKLVIKQIK